MAGTGSTGSVTGRGHRGADSGSRLWGKHRQRGPRFSRAVPCDPVQLTTLVSSSEAPQA